MTYEDRRSNNADTNRLPTAPSSSAIGLDHELARANGDVWAFCETTLFGDGALALIVPGAKATRVYRNEAALKLITRSRPPRVRVYRRAITVESFDGRVDVVRVGRTPVQSRYFELVERIHPSCTWHASDAARPALARNADGKCVAMIAPYNVGGRPEVFEAAKKYWKQIRRRVERAVSK